MHVRTTSLSVLAAFLFAAASSAQTPTTCSQMSTGQGASLNGFIPFPTTDPFNQNIATAAVDPSSAAIIATLGSSPLHPDFGSGLYGGGSIGIPYAVVSNQALVPTNYQAYGGQSDQGPMPIPANAQVEGYPIANAGDDHVLILDQSNCFLYELFRAALQSDGSWNADSGAVWDLLADNARPFTWTSADAAGLPIFPGLARYDEVAAGAIHHALRFTVAHSRAAFVLPATHEAASSTSASYPPLGARFRLKASYNISGFSPQAKIILTALKTYGMILADNGSNMYLSGTPDNGWNNDDLHTLTGVPASAFEVVNTGTVYTNSTTPAGTAPVIASFTATTTTTTTRKTTKTPATTVASGTAVTLAWTSTGTSYYVLTPTAGAVRGTSVTVKPTATTTYTLYANNRFGSTTKTLTITVK